MEFKKYQQMDGVNASTLKYFLDDDGARWEQHINTPQSFKETFDNLRFGTMAHKAVLEPGEFATTPVLPELNLRTKDGRAQRDAFMEQHGDDFMYAQEQNVASMMARALRHSKDSDVGYIMECIDNQVVQTEVTIYGEFRGINAKARLDILWIDKIKAIGDYKTCSDCTPASFATYAMKYNYDLSAAYYMDLYNELHEEQVNQFFLLAQEKKKPYLYTLLFFDIGGKFIESGRIKYARALERYQSYQENGIKQYNGNRVDGDSLIPDYLLKKYLE